MKRQEAEKRGRYAEMLAGLWLRLHGWRVLAKRQRVIGGEVDLIVRRGRIVAFVEVKARADEHSAGFALDRYRLKRVAVAAERLAPRFARTGDDIRIDAIFVVPGRLPRHLVNVWEG